MNYEELMNFTRTACSMIDAGFSEDKLRHYLSSRLTAIFPDSPWWIQAHMEGTETRVRFASGHRNRDGYADAVVGKTAVEYEKNLTNSSIFQEGYHQVREYCAALYNIGIPENEIMGVLSDTVRWYGYSVQVTGEAAEGLLYGPEQIRLTLLSSVDLSLETTREFRRFESFTAQFLNRDHARLLNATTLVLDFGMDSSFYRKSVAVIRHMIQTAMSENPRYAELIRQVWQDFVAYLGASDYGSFSLDTYVNEFYLVTVAKIICADVLAGEPLISDRKTIGAILNGNYFTSQNIFNLVDYDYFGWLNAPPCSDSLTDIVTEMQQRLTAYDFSHISDQDIFGQLLAQLASKDHRLLLGQEFTPHWIAQEIADRSLDRLSGEIPRILDMCCGSGVFLIESIRAVRKRYAINADDYSPDKDAIIFSCVMGFDIDPLAVMLARVNWIMAMRDLFSLHSGGIIVPVYHADSLFTATPITHTMPDEINDSYVLHFDDHQVSLPAFLLTPGHRETFDSFLSVIYRMAMMRAGTEVLPLKDSDTAALIAKITEDSKAEFSDTDRTALTESARQLVVELEHLQRTGRNGIWYFILSNSYRPGLIEHQFNCILSNPPWMAMSKLAVNPYKDALLKIAKNYNINPSGASHPHMELATIFLLNAVDRYLKEDALWSCVLPGSLMSGLNHEPFRSENFRYAKAGLKMQITSLWELPQNTFKNKAIVLSGRKSCRTSPEALEGRIYQEAGKYSRCTYTLNRQGARSAWANRRQENALPKVTGNASVKFTEGCDLFPRTVLFHNLTKRINGNWDITPIERTDDLWYLLSDSKKFCCSDLMAADFDKNYVYDAYISKHLSPFYAASPVKVIIPGKKVQGKWTPLTPVDRALMNVSTSYVFDQIEKNNQEELGSYLMSTINMYGKLVKQELTSGNWLVLSGAGGSHPCAAFVSLNETDPSRIVIDQTLYWYLSESEDEAVYITGLLNSDALSDIIRDFQPEGGFGKRHIHTLPYRIIHAFDTENSLHKNVVCKTRQLIQEWTDKCAESTYVRLLHPNSGSLNSRRKRQQTAIRTLSGYEPYEHACRLALC